MGYAVNAAFFKIGQPARRSDPNSPMAVLIERIDHIIWQFRRAYLPNHRARASAPRRTASLLVIRARCAGYSRAARLAIYRHLSAVPPVEGVRHSYPNGAIASRQ